LSGYKHGLIGLRPIQIERLVGGILSQYHQCEVRHVGRPGDDGIDLLLVLGDESLPVQVKHHLRSGRVEGVAPIRDFVGAILGGDCSTGLFVTTPERYSRPAEEYAVRVVGRGFQVGLVDVHELRKLIGNVVANQWCAYEKAGDRSSLHSPGLLR
jgi:restriction endonuclease Mrr